MIQKEITLQGKTVPVVFGMGTILAFEEITDESFFGKNFIKLKDRIALTFAAIYSADNKTEIKVEDLMESDNFVEVNKATVVVMEMMMEYFKLPKVVAEAEQKEITAEEGEEVKNP